MSFYEVSADDVEVGGMAYGSNDEGEFTEGTVTATHRNSVEIRDEDGNTVRLSKDDENSGWKYFNKS